MNKKNIKLISGVIALMILSPILYQTIFKDGRKSYVNELLENVKKEKTMTAYNNSYLNIKNLNDKYIKESSLEKLEELRAMCTNEEVESIMKDIYILEETGDVEVYNSLIEKLEDLNEPKNEEYYRYEICERDDKLFTDDFLRARDRVEEAEKNLTLEKIEKAKKNISYVENEHNKVYLQDMLNLLESDYDETLKVYDIVFNTNTELCIRLSEELDIDSLDEENFKIDDAKITDIDVREDKKEILIDFEPEDIKKYDDDESFVLNISSIELKNRTTEESEYLINKGR